MIKNKFFSRTAVSLFVAVLCCSLSLYAQPEKYITSRLKGKNYTKVTDVADFASAAVAVKAYLLPTSGIRVPIKVESAYTFADDDSLLICFNSQMADYPFRPQTVKEVYSLTRQNLPEKYKDKKMGIIANDSKIEDLVPPFFNPDSKFFKLQSEAEELLQDGKLAAREEKAEAKKKSAREKDKNFTPPLKSETSRPYDIYNGLQDRHICVSNSHGWYYEPKLDRWEWQRARLFETVEDMYTQSYVIPFLVPMLENAGAVVMMPKERDYNKNEIIVDNDTNTDGLSVTNGVSSWQKGDSLGFANPKESYVFKENPFKLGSYLQVQGLIKSSKPAEENQIEKNESEVKWLPNIPEDGNYAVYISYHSLPESTKSAGYTVKYSGGIAKFRVNQQMGGGIWVYLGTFYFKKGANDQGVYLTNVNSLDKGIVTADAVKFGGGWGNMARGKGDGYISEMPRFAEGARYWLQWSGFPDTVYSYSHNLNDYNDDYVSRGKWTNRLAGGSSKLPNWGYGGEKIPIDLSFALHTDAGTFLNDSIVGTLSIYTRNCEDFGGGIKYPNGEDRLYGRELADIVQTQVVNDVSGKYGFPWTRRGLWDRSYSESRTPQVPGMLLEFLSHENFADMKYGLDPAFRFTAARGMYKGILKFLAFKNNVPYVVEPLPVNDVRVTVDNGDSSDNSSLQQGKHKRKSSASRRSRKNKKNRDVVAQTTPRIYNVVDASKTVYAQVDWSAVEDPEEPTAKPSNYLVYTAIDDNGFDGGTVVKDTAYRVEIEKGKVYRFKICALNEGGKSFPSEVVAVGISGNSNKEKVALIVNAFDRVGSPKWLQSRDSTLAGFFDDYDHGVPYIQDAGFIGSMYEFRRSVPWTDDDAPGFGACHGDYAKMVIAGNTFDYSYDHGIAFMQKGYSFVSSTRSAVEKGKTILKDYDICDMIMGKQAQSNDGGKMKAVNFAVYTPAMREAIVKFCAGGRKLLLSGAYISTDLIDGYKIDTGGKNFASKVLKFKWMTHSASTDGHISAVDNPFGFSGDYNFYSQLNEKKYCCESPDAFTPEEKNAYTIFRYPQTSISAAVAYKGNDYRIASFGFPLETLTSQAQINKLIGQVIDFFEK
ncbi:MAG TPA: xanthan lyase [Candidatus Egerieousia sp.]|nr:xanthan lyase [Candidatus Egerieousia sp.]HPT05075.1 xanthan lyase [Candidatus Egerieousia sp.]